jgi:aspartate carbamoyltransferase catalytic subunit
METEDQTQRLLASNCQRRHAVQESQSQVIRNEVVKLSLFSNGSKRCQSSFRIATQTISNLSSVLTINKSQGQSFECVGI